MNSSSPSFPTAYTPNAMNVWQNDDRGEKEGKKQNKNMPISMDEKSMLMLRYRNKETKL